MPRGRWLRGAAHPQRRRARGRQYRDAALLLSDQGGAHRRRRGLSRDPLHHAARAAGRRQRQRRARPAASGIRQFALLPHRASGPHGRDVRAAAARPPRPGNPQGRRAPLRPLAIQHRAMDEGGVAEGVFRADLDPARAAVLLVSAIAGSMALGASVEQLERIFAEVEAWLVAPASTAPQPARRKRNRMPPKRKQKR